MGGYNPATTDAWEVIRRRQADDRLATREALRVGGTQPFQTTRKTKANIERLDAQQQELANLVNAIPVTRIQQSIQTGFTPSDGWATVATLEMPRPAGKASSITHAIGTVDFAFESTPSGGSIVFPVPRVRMVIAGNVGLESGVRGNYDLSDSVLRINYAGTAQHVHNPGGGGSVTAEIQLSANWPSGDRGSYSFGAATAQLVLTATFTP